MFLRPFTVWLSVAIVTTFLAPSAFAQDPPPNPRVLVETSEGDFEMELFRDRVPATVVNFLIYVRDGYYNGTVFHRVLRNMLIQGGGFVVGDDDLLAPKNEGLRGPIINQASRLLQHTAGTIAMARGSDPDSARQQFFINIDSNLDFNFKTPLPDGIGYAVFGRVTEGMNVVRDIGRTRTGNHGPLTDVPREPVIIESITRIEVPN